MGFPRPEYWSGLSFSSPGDLSDPGIKLMCPALADESFTAEPPGKNSWRGLALTVIFWSFNYQVFVAKRPVCPGSSLISLEQSLRAIWYAVSWLVHFISQIKHNSQLFFPSWQGKLTSYLLLGMRKRWWAWLCTAVPPHSWIAAAEACSSVWSGGEHQNVKRGKTMEVNTSEREACVSSEGLL